MHGHHRGDMFWPLMQKDRRVTEQPYGAVAGRVAPPPGCVSLYETPRNTEAEEEEGKGPSGGRRDTGSPRHRAGTYRTGSRRGT